MRIIAGAYKGRNLKSPPSMQVRPTSDRLRETLFNIIAPLIEDARFLDLCAGSGAVGIEALSRGARHVTFVDRSRKSCQLIQSNVELCRIPEEQYEIYQTTAEDFLSHKKAQETQEGNARDVDGWDIVFFDPPYKENYLPTLRLLKGGLIIVEHHHKNPLPETIGTLVRTRILKQGDSSLSFYAS
ncbi:MAG TPA: 16S rRNA (guanine(966)-N(2))-methyltransferase RsmD [Pyrinomonadaceae bacterium]|nr:16S rRNA (guanine(966)-N(2))-methyltransferase RsmD [Pyrinomonadaceae bacterium]